MIHVTSDIKGKLLSLLTCNDAITAILKRKQGSDVPWKISRTDKILKWTVMFDFTVTTSVLKIIHPELCFLFSMVMGGNGTAVVWWLVGGVGTRQKCHHTFLSPFFTWPHEVKLKKI